MPCVLALVVNGFASAVGVIRKSLKSLMTHILELNRCEYVLDLLRSDSWAQY